MEFSDVQKVWNIPFFPTPENLSPFPYKKTLLVDFFFRSTVCWVVGGASGEHQPIGAQQGLRSLASARSLTWPKRTLREKEREGGRERKGGKKRERINKFWAFGPFRLMICSSINNLTIIHSKMCTNYKQNARVCRSDRSNSEGRWADQRRCFALFLIQYLILYSNSVAQIPSISWWLLLIPLFRVCSINPLKTSVSPYRPCIKQIQRYGCQKTHFSEYSGNTLKSSKSPSILFSAWSVWELFGHSLFRTLLEHSSICS